MNSIATAISNGRTDTSFVDDLNALLGTVNSRVALLLRSIEVHPVAAKMCCSFKRTHPSPFPFYSLWTNRTRGCFVDGRGAHQSDREMTAWNCGRLCLWAWRVGARCNHTQRARSKCQTKHMYTSSSSSSSSSSSITHKARDARRASTTCGVFFPFFFFA